jgi:hypothetical protein
VVKEAVVVEVDMEPQYPAMKSQSRHMELHQGEVEVVSEVT